MTTNALYMSRLRGLSISSKTICSIAMPFGLLPFTAYGNGGSCINVFLPPIMEDQGISVPIFRGGPPIFNE